MKSLSKNQIRDLIDYVSKQVEQSGCDRSHRFTRMWVADQKGDWDATLDLLEAHGCYCDCEVALNLTEDADAKPSFEINPEAMNWRLPPDWEAPEGASYTKAIVCKAGLSENTHAFDGELLVPPPIGTKPRKRVRASVHFFVGCDSGLPSELGVVADTEPQAVEQFAHRVRRSGLGEFRRFTVREAAFVLSKIAALPAATPVGTHFMEVSGVVGRRQELRVHKVILRR